MDRADTITRWQLSYVSAAILATLLAGCGSGSQPANSPANTPPPASSTSRAANGQPDRCHTADLRGSIGTVSGASGKRKVDVYLTNVSDKPCTLEGYPDVQPADSSGTVTKYPTRQSPNPGGTLPQNLSVHPVTLQPSMTAYAVLFFNGAWITDADKKTCVNWTALAVTPPGEQDHVVIPNTDVACMDPLEISPLQS